MTPDAAKRKVANGRPTNDVIRTAFDTTNDKAFPAILGLYVADGSVVADVTYGRGVFWRKVPPDKYKLLATDITEGVDCRQLPYKDREIDCVVFDPPYMHSPGGSTHGSQPAFEQHYRNNRSGGQTQSKYHQAVLDLYVEGGREAWRVLRERGVLIVKCQDEVCSNRQRFTHVEIMQHYTEIGFIAEDLFVIMRRNRPGMSRVIKQVHARKNHSYFLVFWKPGQNNRVWTAP